MSDHQETPSPELIESLEKALIKNNELLFGRIKPKIDSPPMPNPIHDQFLNFNELTPIHPPSKKSQPVILDQSQHQDASPSKMPSPISLGKENGTEQKSQSAKEYSFTEENLPSNKPNLLGNGTTEKKQSDHEEFDDKMNFMFLKGSRFEKTNKFAKAFQIFLELEKETQPVFEESEKMEQEFQELHLKILKHCIRSLFHIHKFKEALNIMESVNEPCST